MFLHWYIQASLQQGVGTLSIYGDDNLLYTSEEITGGVRPINFECNISGVDTLRIEVFSFNGYSITAGVYDTVLTAV